jgi:enoyl-CoA hydratase/carnithine racemase
MGANGVATVTMVRADKHNALDQAMFEGLMNAAEKLADDTSVRAVVLLACRVIPVSSDIPSTR